MVIDIAFHEFNAIIFKHIEVPNKLHQLCHLNAINPLAGESEKSIKNENHPFIILNKIFILSLRKKHGSILWDALHVYKLLE